MNIVFFSHYFPPEGNAPASRTFEHAVRWVAAGHRVTVITCAPNVPDGRIYEGYANRLWPQREIVEGIDVIRVWTCVRANPGKFVLILNYLSYMISSLLAYLFLVRRPHIVVATCPQFFCGWAGVIASWMKWTPLVLEVRDIWPESIIAVGAMRRGLFMRVLELLEKWMYKSATHIVTVGGGYRENILSKVNAHDRLSVVTNGVDPENFRPAFKSDSFQEKWQLDDRFICSYVGTVGLAHGLDVVIRAAKRLKNASRDDIAFLIVGEGARRRELEDLARENDVSDHIIFTGRLDRSAIPTVLANSDCCLVHLAGKDLFGSVIPSKIFETMAMCRPIIMAVKGQAREIVMAADAGTPMEPDSDAELAEIVVRMADNPKTTDQLGCSGRDFVIKHFNRNDLAQDFLDLLIAVAAGVKPKIIEKESWMANRMAPISSCSDAGTAV